MTDADPSTLPQPDIVQLSSTNLDQVRCLLNRFFYPVAVGNLDGAEAFGLGMEVIQLGPLTVGQLSYALPMILTVAEIDAYHVSMPTTGRMQARHAGH